MSTSSDLLPRTRSLHRDFAYAAIMATLSGLEGARAAPSSASCSSTQVLAKLVNASELRTMPDAPRAAAIERIAEGLRAIALANARYRCSNCGYSTQRFIWHCPSCKQWETVRPIQSVQLETVLARP